LAASISCSRDVVFPADVVVVDALDVVAGHIVDALPLPGVDFMHWYHPKKWVFFYFIELMATVKII
jgi:hypothetical protein